MGYVKTTAHVENRPSL